MTLHFLGDPTSLALPELQVASEDPVSSNKRFELQVRLITLMME